MRVPIFQPKLPRKAVVRLIRSASLEILGGKERCADGRNKNVLEMQGAESGWRVYLPPTGLKSGLRQALASFRLTLCPACRVAGLLGSLCHSGACPLPPQRHRLPIPAVSTRGEGASEPNPIRSRSRPLLPFPTFLFLALAVASRLPGASGSRGSGSCLRDPEISPGIY